jgi:MFS family permease
MTVLRKLQRPSNVTIAVGVHFFTALYFYLPVMTLYLLDHGLTLVQISVMHGTILAAQFAAEVPTGIIADRWSRKTTWVAALCLQFLGEAWFFFARAYWEYILIAVIAGIGYAFASGAVEALIYDTLPGQDRQTGMKKALGNISAAGRIGNLVAFLASGVILTQLTPDRFSLAIGLTVFAVGIGLILSLFIFEPAKRSLHHRHTASLAMLKSGFRQLRSSPNLRRIVLLMILSEPFSFYLITFIQIYFVRAGVASFLFGPVFAVGSLLAAFSERYAYAVEAHFGMRRTMLAATTLPGIFYILMAPIRQPEIAVFSLLCLYATMFAARPLLRSYVNHHIADDIRATTLSMIQLLGSIYTALIGLLLGYIGGISISGLFLFMGIVILVAAVAFRIDKRHEEV